MLHSRRMLPIANTYILGQIFNIKWLVLPKNHLLTAKEDETKYIIVMCVSTSTIVKNITLP